MTRQKFSTHKYKQNKTLTNFLDQILTILSHAKLGPYILSIIVYCGVNRLKVSGANAFWCNRSGNPAQKQTKSLVIETFHLPQKA